MHLLFIILLILMLYVALSKANLHPQITAPILLSDYEGQHYLQIEQGGRLDLNCSALEAVEWILPDNALSTGFDKDEVGRRTKIERGFDAGFRSLHLNSVRQSDTGEYVCKTERSQLSSAVYLFVNPTKDSKSVFLNEHPIIIPTPLHEAVILIPCRVNRLITTGVKLFINHVQRYRGFTFDPRRGFNVERRLVGARSETPIRCEYKGDKSEVLVVPSDESDLIQSMPEIEVNNEWPHEGEAYEMSCSFHAQRIYPFSLTWKCPRCEHDSEGVISNRYVKIKEGTRKMLLINSLREEDSGQYQCIVTNADDVNDVRNATRILKVSKTKGQIRVLDVSETIEFAMGDTIKLFHLAKTYPSDEYTSHWRKISRTSLNPEEVYSRVENGVISTLKNDIHDDSLAIPDASVEDSGIYVLTATIGPDLTYSNNWSVVVRSVQDEPRIVLWDGEVLDPSHAVLLHSTLTVICTIHDATKPNPQLYHRRSEDDSWELVRDAEELTDLSYESAVRWRLRVEEPVLLRCEHRDIQPVAELSVAVTDVSDINADLHVTKPESAIDEPANQVFEGDRVDLLCMLPNKQHFDVTWVHKGVLLPPPRREEEAYSQQYVTTLYDVTTDQSGEYECIATLGTDESRRSFTVHLEVGEVTAPFIDEALSEDSHEAEYGESAQLQCAINGSPPPSYRWVKNGNEYTGEGAETASLHFPRVIVEDKGVYTCLAKNRAGAQEASVMLTLLNAPAYAGSSRLWWLFAFALAVVATLLCVAMLFLWKQRRKSRVQQLQLQALYNQLMGSEVHQYSQPPIDPKHPLHERLEQLPYDRKYEISKDKLTFKQVLGGGQFGQVFLGELRKTRVTSAMAASESMPVAIKSPRDGLNVNHQKALADELKVMIAIGLHPNVLPLIGAVTKQMSTGQLYVVMEYCENNNLREFLSKNSGGFLDEVESMDSANTPDGYLAPNHNAASSSQLNHYYKAELDASWDAEVDRERQRGKMITSSDLISFGYQIASGMEYLSSRTCIHRDLAARNVLVTKQRTVRIADFGLARKDERIYHIRNSQNVPLPLKWMALESILNHDFTEQSDVWSYGVVLWELFSLGRVPYPQIANDDLISFLQEGNRLEQPRFAASDIYNLMRQCWLSNATNRPTFSECKVFMHGHLSRASPLLDARLRDQLEEDCLMMEQYGGWRDPEEEEDLRSQATRNGFIAVPSQDPAPSGNLYTQFNR